MDVINSYKCPCCGAPLIYTDGQLHCESCENDFSLEAMQQVAEDESSASAASLYNWDDYQPRSYEDTNEIKLSDYSCSSCGAEIMGDNTLGATVCPYCGLGNIIKGQFEGTLCPDYIIPFKINKNAAMAAFEADFKNIPFLPDEFKNKKKIDEMSGVYVPFWMFDCDCNAAITYSAQNVTHWSDSKYDYTKTDHYKLFRSGTVGFANIPVDGSKKADDAYMEALEPFDYSEAVEFKSAYLSGYFADKYDVSAEESMERANERVKNSTVEAFANTTGAYMRVFQENSSISFSNGKIRYSLLPVWMLNIKYKDKIYNFAINGQTGKVVGSYPEDKNKKRKYFWKIAGIFYIISAIFAYIMLK